MAKMKIHPSMQSFTFRQLVDAVEDYNRVDPVQPIDPLAFSNDKAGLAQVFIERYEALTEEQFNKTADATLDLFNFLVDPKNKNAHDVQEDLPLGYGVPTKKETKVTETKPEVEKTDAPSEAPAAAEAPAEKKKPGRPRREGSSTPRINPNIFDNPKGTTAAVMAVCENPDIMFEDLKERLTEKGFSISDSSIQMVMTDTLRTITYLKLIGRLS